MRCLITAGPTYENLDAVRRLTNFSTGRLGTLLANHLVQRGHHVTLLIGYYSTWRGECHADKVHVFTTTTDLAQQLRRASRQRMDAVFHAAAVSDFGFGGVYQRRPDGGLRRIRSGKFTTRAGSLLAELVPTPKLIASLRDWFPKAVVVGWKYEVEGKREEVLNKARAQVRANRTDACVANGPAYGRGFGLVEAGGIWQHTGTERLLFRRLEEKGGMGATEQA
ncbi:MAG: phosphopantothenoylcysteine decarboxylase [Verrucomicrobiota bacterium]